MSPKKLFLIFLILLIFAGGLLAIRFYFGGEEDEWRCENGQWVMHGRPALPMPNDGCDTEKLDNKNEKFEPARVVVSLVRDYLDQNISQLSPEKEVLGGKFYLTNLEFRDNETAIVSYEDGHNAFMAMFRFSLNETEDVIPLDFQILNKN